MDEPTGYFPPVQDSGYFPPMDPSNLANEILRDKTGDGDTAGSVSSGATDKGIRNGECPTSNPAAPLWHTPEKETQAEATLDSQDKEPSSIFGVHGDDLVNGADGIVRTNSMSVPGTKVDRVPINRGTSDPAHVRSREQDNISHRDGATGDTDGREKER
jgi:hypothetical protein